MSAQVLVVITPCTTSGCSIAGYAVAWQETSGSRDALVADTTSNLQAHPMKNPLLPDPDKYPQLYAREYARLQPVLDRLWLVIGLLMVPPVACLLYVFTCLIFGYGPR